MILRVKLQHKGYSIIYIHMLTTLLATVLTTVLDSYHPGPLIRLWCSSTHISGEVCSFEEGTEPPLSSFRPTLASRSRRRDALRLRRGGVARLRMGSLGLLRQPCYRSKEPNKWEIYGWHWGSVTLRMDLQFFWCFWDDWRSYGWMNLYRLYRWWMDSMHDFWMLFWCVDDWWNCFGTPKQKPGMFVSEEDLPFQV